MDQLAWTTGCPSPVSDTPPPSAFYAPDLSTPPGGAGHGTGSGPDVWDLDGVNVGTPVAPTPLDWAWISTDTGTVPPQGDNVTGDTTPSSALFPVLGRLSLSGARTNTPDTAAARASPKKRARDDTPPPLASRGTPPSLRRASSGTVPHLAHLTPDAGHRFDVGTDVLTDVDQSEDTVSRPRGVHSSPLPSSLGTTDTDTVLQITTSGPDTDTQALFRSRGVVTSKSPVFATLVDADAASPNTEAFFALPIERHGHAVPTVHVPTPPGDTPPPMYRVYEDAWTRVATHLALSSPLRRVDIARCHYHNQTTTLRVRVPPELTPDAAAEALRSLCGIMPVDATSTHASLCLVIAPKGGTADDDSWSTITSVAKAIRLQRSDTVAAARRAIRAVYDRVAIVSVSDLAVPPLGFAAVNASCVVGRRWALWQRVCLERLRPLMQTKVVAAMTASFPVATDFDDVPPPSIIHVTKDCFAHSTPELEAIWGPQGMGMGVVVAVTRDASAVVIQRPVAITRFTPKAPRAPAGLVTATAIVTDWPTSGNAPIITTTTTATSAATLCGATTPALTSASASANLFSEACVGTPSIRDDCPVLLDVTMPDTASAGGMFEVLRTLRYDTTPRCLFLLTPIGHLEFMFAWFRMEQARATPLGSAATLWDAFEWEEAVMAHERNPECRVVPMPMSPAAQTLRVSRRHGGLCPGMSDAGNATTLTPIIPPPPTTVEGVTDCLAAPVAMTPALNAGVPFSARAATEMCRLGERAAWTTGALAAIAPEVLLAVETAVWRGVPTCTHTFVAVQGTGDCPTLANALHAHLPQSCTIVSVQATGARLLPKAWVALRALAASPGLLLSDRATSALTRLAATFVNDKPLSKPGDAALFLDLLTLAFIQPLVYLPLDAPSEVRAAFTSGGWAAALTRLSATIATLSSSVAVEKARFVNDCRKQLVTAQSKRGAPDVSHRDATRLEHLVELFRRVTGTVKVAGDEARVPAHLIRAVLRVFQSRALRTVTLITGAKNLHGEPLFSFVRNGADASSESTLVLSRVFRGAQRELFNARPGMLLPGDVHVLRPVPTLAIVVVPGPRRSATVDAIPWEVLNDMARTDERFVVHPNDTGARDSMYDCGIAALQANTSVMIEVFKSLRAGLMHVLCNTPYDPTLTPPVDEVLSRSTALYVAWEVVTSTREGVFARAVGLVSDVPPDPCPEVARVRLSNRIDDLCRCIEAARTAIATQVLQELHSDAAVFVRDTMNAAASAAATRFGLFATNAVPRTVLCAAIDSANAVASTVVTACDMCIGVLQLLVTTVTPRDAFVFVVNKEDLGTVTAALACLLVRLRADVSYSALAEESPLRVSVLGHGGVDMDGIGDGTPCLKPGTGPGDPPLFRGTPLTSPATPCSARVAWAVSMSARTAVTHPGIPPTFVVDEDLRNADTVLRTLNVAATRDGNISKLTAWLSVGSGGHQISQGAATPKPGVRYTPGTPAFGFSPATIQANHVAQGARRRTPGGGTGPPSVPMATNGHGHTHTPASAPAPSPRPGLGVGGPALSTTTSSREVQLTRTLCVSLHERQAMINLSAVLAARNRIVVLACAEGRNAAEGGAPLFDAIAKFAAALQAPFDPDGGHVSVADLHSVFTTRPTTEVLVTIDERCAEYLSRTSEEGGDGVGQTSPIGTLVPALGPGVLRLSMTDPAAASTTWTPRATHVVVCPTEVAEEVVIHPHLLSSGTPNKHVTLVAIQMPGVPGVATPPSRILNALTQTRSVVCIPDALGTPGEAVVSTLLAPEGTWSTRSHSAFAVTATLSRVAARARSPGTINRACHHGASTALSNARHAAWPLIATIATNALSQAHQNICSGDAVSDVLDIACKSVLDVTPEICTTGTCLAVPHARALAARLGNHVIKALVCCAAATIPEAVARARDPAVAVCWALSNACNDARRFNTQIAPYAFGDTIFPMLVSGVAMRAHGVGQPSDDGDTQDTLASTICALATTYRGALRPMCVFVDSASYVLWLSSPAAITTTRLQVFVAATLASGTLDALDALLAAALWPAARDFVCLLFTRGTDSTTGTSTWHLHLRAFHPPASMATYVVSTPFHTPLFATLENHDSGRFRVSNDGETLGAAILTPASPSMPCVVDARVLVPLNMTVEVSCTHGTAARPTLSTIAALHATRAHTHDALPVFGDILVVDSTGSGASDSGESTSFTALGTNMAWYAWLRPCPK